MKSLFGLFAGALFLVSCSTKDVAAPVKAFYQDANVSVQELEANLSDNNTAINVSFSTLYLKNIQKIEIMSSGDNTNFCTRKTFTINNPSESNQVFDFVDTDIKGTPMYYMLRFMDMDNNWSYSTVYTYDFSL